MWVWRGQFAKDEDFLVQLSHKKPVEIAAPQAGPQDTERDDRFDHVDHGVRAVGAMHLDSSVCPPWHWWYVRDSLSVEHCHDCLVIHR